jgi:NAD(P)-dependent dehydrogenase (short-subunit alcohol dehydrogenase family)
VRDEPRIAIVGASSGLGRTIGIGLAGRGARVALLARRASRLESAAASAGNGARAIVCDVTDECSCQSAIADAATAWGGLDGLVYATGALAISPLENVDAATWAHLFATNVTGAALVTAAALPYLQASRGVAIYLSSISASLTAPWPKIGSYVTSKAALDKLVEAWQVEQPHIRFTRLAVGDCAGGSGESSSEFVNHIDPVVIADAISEWLRLGYMTGNLIAADHLVETVDAILRCPSAIPTLTLAPTTP